MTGKWRTRRSGSVFSSHPHQFLPIDTIAIHIRQVLSHEAAHQVKQLGLENDLIDRIREDSYFDPIKGELEGLLDPASFVGRAPEQVDSFLKEWVEPALADDELQEAVGMSGKVDLSV